MRLGNIIDDRKATAIKKDATVMYLDEDSPVCTQPTKEACEKPDNINHPIHYTQGKIECIDAEKIFLEGMDGFEAGLAFNMFKYIFRCAFKNGNEDVKKARWYYDKLKEEIIKTNKNVKK